VKFSAPKKLFKSTKKDSKKEDATKNETKEAKSEDASTASVGERKLFGVFRIKNNKQLVLIGVIVAIVLWLAITAVGLYAFRWENNYALQMTKYVPYPVATVNGHFVSYYSYLENVEILKKYQKEFKKVDFKSADGKKILEEIRKQTMDRLAEDTIIKSEADKLKVKISQKELDDSYNQLIKSNGGEKSFAEVLNKYYGLTPAEFKVDIYKARLVRQKVMEKFSSDESLNQDAKKKAEEVLGKVKAGGNFQELAKQYSEDTTASNGGDLGLFAKGKMVPEFETAAFALKAGETSGIVKTVYGYHIIKVAEVKGDQIHAYHILIKTKDFQTWLDESMKQTKFHYFRSI